MTPTAEQPLLEVRNLVKHFPLREPGLFGRRLGTVKAVDGVTFSVNAGETLAIVGESGCGKSTLAKTLSLIYPPDGGRLYLEGHSLARQSGEIVRAARRKMQMIFQDPFGSLNPRLTVGEIIAEPLIIRRDRSAAERRRMVLDATGNVGLAEADLAKYPHQFSGGQRQRIAIARAIVASPKLVIADEPLSALDVSIQSQILNLFVDLQDRLRLTYLFISHDLPVVGYVADRIAVMYLGRIVEIGPAESVLAKPRHPYTRLLVDSAPIIGAPRRARHHPAETDIPSPMNSPGGCPFHTRCPKTKEICQKVRPELIEPEAAVGGGLVACHIPEE